MNQAHFTRIAILLSTIVLGSACEGPESQSEPTETDENPVRHGTHTFERPEVGLLRTNLGWCTATLISDQHILTAAHCTGYAAMATGGTFTIHANDGVGTPHEFSIERIISIGASSRAADPADLAVGRLATKVPSWLATAATIGLVATHSGDTLTHIGYGYDGLGGPSRTKRTRTYVKTNADRIFESGDSGGPVFSGSLADGGPIVFTSARSYLAPVLADRDAYGDPVKYRNYILSLVNSLDHSGVCYRYIRKISGGWSEVFCDGRATPPDPIGGIQVWTGQAAGLSVCYAAVAPKTFGALSWSTEACDGDALWWYEGGFGFDYAKRGGHLSNFKIRLNGGQGTESVLYHAGNPSASAQNNQPIVAEPPPGGSYPRGLNQIAVSLF